VLFIGLPSDDPYKDISVLLSIKNSWVTLQPLVNDQKQQLGKLPAQATKESKEELSRIIAGYVDWQSKLTENTFQIISQYISDIHANKVLIPGNVHLKAQEINDTNYQQTVNDFNAFLDQRVEQVPNEIQQISSVHARLKAVRLFDGMLRSYYSSINWAEWKNTRE
jgi:hypothetical protein